MKLLLFILIEVILYPITMIGQILFMGVILLVNRRKGVSGSAYEPFMNRLLWHDVGTREDTAARQLSRKLPATSPFIWAMLMGPTLLAIRVSGYMPAMFNYAAAPSAWLMNTMVVRTRFMDSTLEHALGEVQQLVILGAGWDTRAYALPDDWQGRVFEVDAPRTQSAKLEAVRAAGLDTSHVTFVAVDFNTASWLKALKAEGFDPEVPTYFLWEGVTMYLDEAAIHDTLRTISQLAEGSRIAFDYFAAELVKGRKPYALIGSLIPVMVWMFYGEKITFGIPMHPEGRNQLEAFLHDLGLELVQFEMVGGYYSFTLAKPLAD